MDAIVPITPALDGARVLCRHWTSTQPPREGFIREFSPDQSLVRISKTNFPTDAGYWHRCAELRIDAVLEHAPATRIPQKSKEESEA